MFVKNPGWVGGWLVALVFCRAGVVVVESSTTPSQDSSVIGPESVPVVAEGPISSGNETIVIEPNNPILSNQRY